MKNIRKLLVVILLLLPLSAFADALYLGGVSKHFGSNYDSDGYKYNDNHEMIVIEYSNVFLGTMLNSYHERSYVVGYQYGLIEEKYFNLDLALGVISGYTEEQNDIFRIGGVNGFGALMLEANTPYVKPVVMLFGTAFVFSIKYEF
ncbi:putative TMhelix containing protein [Vibrio phage 193E37-1]|nr:putative TMhelix containing protein [Vibrio phage 193E37-1]